MKLLATFAASLVPPLCLFKVPAVAQDKGKTAAAELTADSEKPWPPWSPRSRWPSHCGRRPPRFWCSPA